MINTRLPLNGLLQGFNIQRAVWIKIRAISSCNRADGIFFAHDWILKCRRIQSIKVNVTATSMALLTVESSQYKTNTPKCWCKPRLFIFMLSSWEINNSDINHRVWKQKTSTGAKQTKPRPPCKPLTSYFVRPYLCLLGSHLHHPHCWATESPPLPGSHSDCAVCAFLLKTAQPGNSRRLCPFPSIYPWEGRFISLC